MTVQNWLSFPFQIPHMVLSSIKTKCIEDTENGKLFILHLCFIHFIFEFLIIGFYDVK